MKGIDELDRKILVELAKNSNLPVTALSNKVEASREVVDYRIDRLVERGIIKNFITEIDTSKLGFVGSAVFVNIKAEKEEDFMEFLGSSDSVSWVAKLSGVWSFGLSILARDNDELDRKFREIYTRYEDAIRDHRFTMHRENRFFYEKYLGAEPDFIEDSEGEEKEYEIDDIDRTILQELATDARMNSVELAQKTPVSSQAVRDRISDLEESGYIQKYTIFMDLSKLGLFEYSIFIENKDVNERQDLLRYLEHHPKVSFIAEYMGDPFLEFGLFVDDPYKLREILMDIEESFPNNRLIEISLFQKDIVSIGPPPCVFE